jgi:hypothetical protein
VLPVSGTAEGGAGRGGLGDCSPDHRVAFLSCVNYRTCVAMTLKLVEDSIAQL